LIEGKVLTEEKLGFNRKFLIGGNLGLLAWVFLAFLSVLFYNQIAGWIYLLLIVFLIYVVLRRIGCNNCYKCKTCTSGFGRLAGVFFGKGLMKKESVGNMLVFIVFIYALLFPLPLVTLVLSLSNSFSFPGILVLICLLLVSAYSFLSSSNSSTKTAKT
jgi:small-conductance mechanosensitive channel